MAVDADQVASELLGRVRQAWDDGSATADTYTEDAVLVHANGAHNVGRAEIERAMGGGFAGRLKGSTLTAELVSARALADGVVLARARAQISGPEVQLPPFASMIAIVDDGGTWRVTAWQNTPLSS